MERPKCTKIILLFEVVHCLVFGFMHDIASHALLRVLYVVKSRSFDQSLHRISGEMKENQCVYPWNENSGCVR
jgi:hypothetical protein